MDEAVSWGDKGRLDSGEGGGTNSSALSLRRDIEASLVVLLLELRIRYTYGYTMVAEGSSNEAESNSYTSSP